MVLLAHLPNIYIITNNTAAVANQTFVVNSFRLRQKIQAKYSHIKRYQKKIIRLCVKRRISRLIYLTFYSDWKYCLSFRIVCNIARRHTPFIISIFLSLCLLHKRYKRHNIELINHPLTSFLRMDKCVNIELLQSCCLFLVLV